MSQTSVCCVKAGQLVSQPSFRKFFMLFLSRKSQRRPRGENDREAAARLTERSRKTTLIAQSFRALGVRRLLLPTFSHRGITQACGLPRNTIRSVRGCCQSPHRNPFFRKPKACTTALRKARKKRATINGSTKTDEKAMPEHERIGRLHNGRRPTVHAEKRCAT